MDKKVRNAHVLAYDGIEIVIRGIRNAAKSAASHVVDQNVDGRFARALFDLSEEGFAKRFGGAFRP